MPEIRDINDLDEILNSLKKVNAASMANHTGMADLCVRHAVDIVKKMKQEAEQKEAQWHEDRNARVIDESIEMYDIVHVSVGDLFIFKLQENGSGGYMWNHAEALKDNFEIISVECISLTEIVDPRTGEVLDPGPCPGMALLTIRAKVINIDSKVEIVLQKVRPWLTPKDEDYSAGKSITIELWPGKRGELS